MIDHYRIAPKLTGHVIGLQGFPVQADQTEQSDAELSNEYAVYVVPSPGELRGIPAVGRHAGAGAIGETIPGWDLDDWPLPDVA